MNYTFANSSRNANSLLPLGVPGANAINKLRVNVENLNQRINDTLTNTYNTAANKVANTVGNIIPVANVANLANSPMVALNKGTNAAASAASGLGVSGFVIFAGLVVAFLVLFTYFRTEITSGYNAFIVQLRDTFGMKIPTPDQQQQIPMGQELDVLKPSTPPEAEANLPSSLAEKVLPQGGSGPEVFNISKNTFTYYDSEPLCKALGAELATYEQVKQAWDRGADWCNYGWVKGQNAVFPTSKQTWEKLQSGPEEQRMACGKPGINGGYFDNPELRFGVNCYGSKPSQSKHDEEAVAKRSGVPLTPSGIEFDKKVSKFRGESDHIGVLPFNEQKWSSS
jgi:hypothetical protein